jgi:hypothetical protein
MKKPTKNVLKKKFFLVKNLNFWPIVKDATGLKLLSTLFSATMGQNCAECKTKSTKNSQFIVKITRNFHYGPISQKVPYRIFSNISFWKAPRVPNNIHTGVYQTHEVWKTRPKKGV